MTYSSAPEDLTLRQLFVFIIMILIWTGAAISLLAGFFHGIYSHTGIVIRVWLFPISILWTFIFYKVFKDSPLSSRVFRKSMIISFVIILLFPLVEFFKFITR